MPVMTNAWCTQLSKVNSGATESNLIKFIHNVGQFIAPLTYSSVFQYSNLFEKASVTNEGKSANFSSKIGLPWQRPQ